jgi:hypothetical protein
VSFRYDLLCIEGIARALRVFLGKGKTPEHRLVYPPGGEKDIIEVTVAPTVSRVSHFGFHVLTSVLDSPSSPLLRCCCPSKCQIYATVVRLVHRFTREVTPKHLSETTIRCHRHARSGYHHGAIPLRGQASQGHKIRPPEQDTSVHCRRTDDGL